MGIALDTPELAWAAGLFDAEGTAGAYRRRSHYAPQLMLSQAGIELPEVLRRFRDAVGGQGLFIGPVRGYLYYWYTHRFESIQAVTALLWTWVGRRKRTQLRRTLLLARGLDPGTVVPSAPLAWDTEHELAWAAGFFGGEGWIGGHASGAGGRVRWIKMSIAQAADGEGSIPELLTRFRAAVGGVGTIRGPKLPKNPWSRRPQYQWGAGSCLDITRIVASLSPWLDTRKRAQAERALALYRSTPSLRELREQSRDPIP